MYLNNNPISDKMQINSKQVQKKQTKRNSGSECQFPGKLHEMMSFVERQNLESIISWVMNGHGIMINDPDKLVQILPLFFSQTKYRSFRRQLNMWRFERILEGPDKGAFTHPYFIRGRKMLCSHMSRHITNDIPTVSLARKISNERMGQMKATTNVMASPWHAGDDIVRMAAAEAEAIIDDKTDLMGMGTFHDTTLVGDFKDGDLADFAGKQFYVVDTFAQTCDVEPNDVFTVRCSTNNNGFIPF